MTRQILKNKVIVFVFLFGTFSVFSSEATADSFEPSSDERPNILFAIADDWGWPHATSYGDSVCQTPTFDRVAREGMLFQNAFVSSPSCTPSRNAILTGQHFWRLGGGANLHSVLDTKHKSFVHLLADAGYETGYMRKMWGPGDASNWTVNPAGKRYKNFDQFLDQRDVGKPFCFCFGAFDPHRGYELGSGKKSGMELNKIKLLGCFPDSDTIRSDVADYYFEVQRFDRELGVALHKLEEIGQLENTIVVVTGDHGMPFPRCKSNLYDSGTHVPLAIRWPATTKPGSVSDEFVSTTDFAPTFLQAADLTVPTEMTGQSLLPIFAGDATTQRRDHVIFGKERHVPAQEGSDVGGYPMRAIRTAEFLLIENFRPDRWPNGTPNYKQSHIPFAWLADTDNGPTKTYIVENRDKDQRHTECYDLCFGKRPRFELYHIGSDPEQLNNVAEEPKFAETQKRLRELLKLEGLATNDPRAIDSDAADKYFDSFEYLGSGPRHPSWKRKRGPKE